MMFAAAFGTRVFGGRLAGVEAKARAVRSIIPEQLPHSARVGLYGGSQRGAGQGHRGTCVVRLIDRRTGLPHRVGGSPLTIITQEPAEAAAELLEGRDASVWEVRIDPIEP